MEENNNYLDDLRLEHLDFTDVVDSATKKKEFQMDKENQGDYQNKYKLKAKLRKNKTEKRINISYLE